VTWALLVQQLQVSVSTAQARPPRFNPRPPGQIQDGSGTHAILEYLRANPDRWMTRCQIIEGTGRSQKSCDWGLAFLIQQGIVRAVQDSTRNPRYRRFKYSGK
jgi:hypothetical protein